MLEGSGAGVLEIKCPYNRGEPFSAKPYPNAPWYYMAQVWNILSLWNCRAEQPSTPSQMLVLQAVLGTSADPSTSSKSWNNPLFCLLVQFFGNMVNHRLGVMRRNVTVFFSTLQVQGLMEIFDREWCNAFSYTVNGAAVYHIKRDRRYWADVFEVLADFWWAHLIPAKHALAAGLPEDAQRFE